MTEVCPKCKTDNYETTCVGYFLINNNSVTCHTYGWKGKGYELLKNEACLDMNDSNLTEFMNNREEEI
jgi:hypothetical protein